MTDLGCFKQTLANQGVEVFQPEPLAGVPDQLMTRDIGVVLSLSPTQVIARTCASRIKAEMRRRGLAVIELPFDDPPKTGGSFRCCSLPLWRET